MACIWLRLIVFLDWSWESFNKSGLSCDLLKFSCELKIFVDVTFRETFSGTLCFDFTSLEGSLIYSIGDAGYFIARAEGPKDVETVWTPLIILYQLD